MPVFDRFEPCLTVFFFYSCWPLLTGFDFFFLNRFWLFWTVLPLHFNFFSNTVFGPIDRFWQQVQESWVFFLLRAQRTLEFYDWFKGKLVSEIAILLKNGQKPTRHKVFLWGSRLRSAIASCCEYWGRVSGCGRWRYTVVLACLIGQFWLILWQKTSDSALFFLARATNKIKIKLLWIRKYPQKL